MDLIDIFIDLDSEQKYRYHMAKPNDQGHRPLDALASSKDAWLQWQLYKGKKKDRFKTPYIVSFAQISGSRFLFGGVFKITDRKGEKYKAEQIKKYSDLIGRLVIRFEAKNTRGTVFKPDYVYVNSTVSGIFEQPFKGEAFKSFDHIRHGFNDIEVIINNALPDWKAALSSVYGVYLLTDKHTGKHYVGSAYGDEGLWGRWNMYVNNYHGTNKELKHLFKNSSEKYFRDNFMFSVLEVLSPHTSKNDVIAKENLWKEKLLTKEFGLNAN